MTQEAAPPPPEPTEPAVLTEPVLVPPQGLVPALLCALILTVGAAVLFAPPQRPLVLPVLELATWRHAADLDALRPRDDALLASVPAGATETALQAEWSQWLGREAVLGATDVPTDPEAQTAQRAVVARAKALWQTGGEPAVRAAAVRFGRAVRQAMERVLAVARTEGRSLDGVLVSLPDRQEVTGLLQLAGGLAQSLAVVGFERHFRDGELDPAAGRVVEALASARLLHAIGPALPAPVALPAADEMLLLRFRVEAHPALPLARRLDLIATLAARDRHYPHEWARGVWLAREEHWAEAETAFEQAAERGQRPREARVNARWCRKKSSESLE
jgi:predicted transcriptional regulator